MCALDVMFHVLANFHDEIMINAFSVYFGNIKLIFSL